MSNINSSTIFRHVDDVRYRIIDEEAVVIRQEAGEVLGINPTGTRLLDLIDGKASVAHLLDALNGEFDADRVTLERDVICFLEELQDAGVIEETN